MKKINISEGVDRISELSDEVLGHILSFLPSKEAIATCSLSKRWRYVWKLVSALDFVCLPDMTIKAHTKPWNDLDLERNTGPCCLFHIQEFVDAAIAVKVEQLSISMAQHGNRNYEHVFMSQHRNHGPVFFVPANLFNCATIVTLKLEGPLKEFRAERNSQGNLIVSNNLRNLHEYDYVYMTLHKVDDHSHVVSMLNAMQNVEFLCDWKEMMEVNHHCSIDSPQFPNLVHLELRLRNNVVSLPINLFTCTTLVNLKIEGSFTLSVPSCIQLSSLKRLHLNLRNCEPASCKAILSGSPALEFFHLKHEWRDGFEDLIIERNSGANLIVSKNQLINLVIQSDGGYDCFQDYFEGHLENIVKAKVFMTLDPNWSSNIREVYTHAYSILKAMRNVEFLSLCDISLEGYSSVDLPKLPNLVQLQLHINHYSSQILKLVSSEYCPKLEEFGVNNMHWKYSEQQKKWINMTTRGMHPDHYGPLS
ncbi:F-box/LRR-repeat protein At2g42730-like [Lotus japonicus]|uniref:F-box/LRR-repeat protein At2g42730-like n=1 Tax=Lotus japonicus TaxID=34305 RepID=UPI0025861297|nr:F-box/LRR-repeat protein At2g42730-like [Lotus japonicus]